MTSRDRDQRSQGRKTLQEKGSGQELSNETKAENAHWLDLQRDFPEGFMRVAIFFIQLFTWKTDCRLTGDCVVQGVPTYHHPASPSGNILHSHHVTARTLTLVQDGRLPSRPSWDNSKSCCGEVLGSEVKSEWV